MRDLPHVHRPQGVNNHAAAALLLCVRAMAACGREGKEGAGTAGGPTLTRCHRRRRRRLCIVLPRLANHVELLLFHANSSLGPMKAFPAPPHVGEWDCVFVPSERSIVPLPNDFRDGGHPLPCFTDRTAFVNLFPGLQINVTWDCMWWMRLQPDGPSSTRISMGFCFPRSTVTLPTFPHVFELHVPSLVPFVVQWGANNSGVCVCVCVCAWLPLHVRTRWAHGVVDQAHKAEQKD